MRIIVGKFVWGTKDSDSALYEVISPKFHDTSLLERFAESESGEIDNTVGRLTRNAQRVCATYAALYFLQVHLEGI